jgi:hypothetical protein
VYIGGSKQEGLYRRFYIGDSKQEGLNRRVYTRIRIPYVDPPE